MRDLDLQEHTVSAGTEVFGVENMTNPEERLLRFAEEFFELVRAAGMPFDKLAAMLCYEYYVRKKGDVPQEIAGVQCTLYSLAEVLGYDVRIETLKEIERILAKKEECRAKHAAKPVTMKAA
jgi:hypothetical protein